VNNKIVAIVGSYRKNGIIDQTVTAILAAAEEHGADTQKVYLTDKTIEFCTNCRACTQDKSNNTHGDCAHDDDMKAILADIEDAGGLILASPINIGTVTAIMKRFVERLIVYTYWPWGKLVPRKRVRRSRKSAVLVTSSSCPSWLGRIIMPNALRMMKTSAGLVGAKVVKTLYFGTACDEPNQKLTPGQLRAATRVGAKLAARIGNR